MENLGLKLIEMNQLVNRMNHGLVMEEQDDNSSRRIMSNNNNNTDLVVVDRISSLPDFILGDILSFLPTKQAVATSLLSKRWKSAWLDVHSLDFQFLSLVPPHSAENKAFIRFVYRVLRLTDGRQLNKFSLDWLAGVISSHVSSWIDAAISRNVREITLYLGCDGDLLKPISGFNSDSLRSLRLRNITFVNDTTVVCLPRLETLHLCSVRFTSKEAFEKLINGCPMLHYLRIVAFKEEEYDDDDDDAEEACMRIVSSPSLRHLDMYIEDRYAVELNAPSLEYLKLHGRISGIFVGKSLSSLVEADFYTQSNDCDFHIGAVRALEHVKFLTLSTSVMRALGFATASLSTKFKRLVKLVSHTDCCCCLLDFVHNTENLEELVTYQGDCLPLVTNDVAHHHSRWTVPVVVPRCFSKSLKKVQLAYYKGLEDERETIRFMLEHGIALEVMQIYCKNKGEDEEKLLKVICEFPRKSPACKVVPWPT